MKPFVDRLQSLTLQDIALVILCALTIYLLRGRDTHLALPQWRHELNIQNYANHKYPSQSEHLPNPIITDFESDGKNEIVLITSDHQLQVLVLPGRGPDISLPLLQLKNSTQLPVGREGQQAAYPVAMESGFLDAYQGMVQIRKQVIIVALSNWNVLCYDHHLELQWERNLLEVSSMEEAFSPKAFSILISPHQVAKDDRGSIIIGGSFAHKSHSAPRENSEFQDRAEGNPGGIDPAKMKEVRNRRQTEENADVKFTHFSTFCLSGDGVLRWHHLPGDFVKKTEAREPPAHHWKLALKKHERHSGEEHWSVYKQDLFKQLPYLWSSLPDTKMELTVLRKNSQIPKDIQQTEASTATDVFGKHLEGYAYGGNRPHSRHEHIQHPNTVVIHNHDGIEALNLNTGAPYARLQLGEEKTVFADVNDDGAIERVKTNFDGENCDAEVVTLQPTAQVLFSGPLCDAPGWLGSLSLSSAFFVDPQVSEDTHVSVPPMLVRSVALRSSPAHHLMGRALPSQRLGHDSVYITSTGRLTSYGPYGEFNWQVRVPARWAEASRMASDVDHYQFDLSTIDVFNNAFTPSMTPYSPLVFGKKTAAIVLGWDHVAMVNLQDGHILAEHSLPCQPLQGPTVGDFNNDGWTDFIVTCSSGHIGFTIQSKPSYLYMVGIAVTVVLGMYILTWCFRPEVEEKHWDKD